MCNTPNDPTKALVETDNNNVQNFNNAEQATEAPSSEMNVSELLQEIKTLQTKVASLEVAVAEKYNVQQIEYLVQQFSGDGITTVEKWIADLENAFQTLELNGKQKIIAASRMLTGTAAVFLRTIRVSKYEDLKTELIKEFGSAIAVEKAKQKLRKGTRDPGQPIRRYVLAMVEVAMNFDIPEQELVDIIIEGLNDSSINAVMLYRARTVNELKALIDRYEEKRISMVASITKQAPLAINSAPVQLHNFKFGTN